MTIVMCKVLTLIILCTQLFLSHQRVNKQYAGPYDFKLERLQPCADQGSNVATLVPFRLTKASGFVISYSGTLVLGKPMDDKVTALVTIDVWGNGGWRNNYFVRHFDDPCNFLIQVLPEWMEAVFKIGNVTGCPAPAGNYTVENFRLDFTPKVKILPYGKYKVELAGFYEKERIGCGVGYYEVSPKAVDPKGRRRPPHN